MSSEEFVAVNAEREIYICSECKHWETDLKVGELIGTIEYDYPTFHLSMDCFWCEVIEGDLKLLEAESARWLTKDTLYDVQRLPADITIIEKIEEQME